MPGAPGRARARLRTGECQCFQDMVDGRALCHHLARGAADCTSCEMILGAAAARLIQASGSCWADSGVWQLLGVPAPESGLVHIL